jgi:hypothetical protein
LQVFADGGADKVRWCLSRGHSLIVTA